jgi:outer membrane receptor protein involved in Fe transport
MQPAAIPIAPTCRRAAILFVIGLYPTLLSAQPPRPDSARAHRHEAPSAPPALTLVLTREEIRETPAQTLDDLIRTIATVNLPAQGSLIADPATATISMRGLAGNGVLVLVDGVPLNDSYFGTVNWLKIPVERIERIEIVHGAGTARYAAQAVAGVVLVTTRRPAANGFELQAAFGSYLAANSNPYRRGRNHNTGRANLLASAGLAGNARVTVHANFTGTKGFWLARGGDESFTTLSSTTAGARVDLAPSPRSAAFATINAAAMLPHTVAPATDVSELTLRRKDTRAVDAAAGLTLREVAGGTLESMAVFSDTRRWRTAGYYGDPSDRTATRDGSASVTWSRDLDVNQRAFHLSAGSDVRAISSSTTLRADSALPFQPGTRVSADGASRMAGAYGQMLLAVSERVMLRAALRINGFHSTAWQYATSEAVTATVPARTRGWFSPTVGLSYAVRPGWTIRGSAYAGSNPLVHADLSPLRSVGREPRGLRPERVRGGEVGAEVRRGAFVLGASVFQQNLKDGVTGSGTEFDFSLENGEARRSRGVEMAGEWSPRQSLVVRASHTYLSAIVTANPFETEGFEFFSLVGIRDQNVPIHSIAASLRGRLSMGAQALVRGRYQSRYAPLPGFGLIQPAPFAVFDASLMLPLAREFELWIRGENILNRRYGVDLFVENYGAAAPSLLTVGLQLTPRR